MGRASAIEAWQENGKLRPESEDEAVFTFRSDDLSPGAHCSADCRWWRKHLAEKGVDVDATISALTE